MWYESVIDKQASLWQLFMLWLIDVTDAQSTVYCDTTQQQL